MPDADLLASRFNNKLTKFVSRSRDPLAFPPLKHLPHLLCRFDIEDILVIFTAPFIRILYRT